MNSLKEFFDLKQLDEYLTKETQNTVSLESLMLKGEKSDVWVQSAHKFGEFAAKFSTLTSRSSVKDEDRDRFLNLFKSSSNCLYLWLNESASDEESILAILPERQRPSADAIGLRKKSEAARELLSKKESVSLQHLTSDKILVDATNQSKLTAGNDFTMSTTSLDSAIFIADMIVNYYEMTTRHVDHAIQYRVVEVVNEFGKNYDLTAQKLNPNYNNQTFWKEVALLSGWEIVRRCHALDRVQILSDENEFGGVSDCMQAGMRLISNARIDSVNFLMVVALMLAF
jgi:hypothetical protein